MEQHDRWRMGFHIMPPTGWLNDPNGLCQVRGIYHVFHQYSPAWPEPGAARGWGHAVSRDLVHWRHLGSAIVPDTPEEASGSYSGCAVRTDEDGGTQIRFYYTGNVKEPGDHDYVREGRQANQLLIESPDAVSMGDKRVLLRNADYPSNCTCHVRDPKVWRDDKGTWWMILGARDTEDHGFILRMRSDDGYAWEPAGEVRSDTPLGFMWECPDRIVLDGHVYLSVCPQGLADLPWANGMRDQSGHFALPAGADLSDGHVQVAVADFSRWDAGFDFYAPQTFVDERGRTLLIGWMGVPDAPFDSAPDGLDWCHCLTVPRVLSRCEDGAIAQMPVPELAALREDETVLSHGAAALASHRADIELAGIDGPLSITLDDGLAIGFDGHGLSMRFIGDAGAPTGMGAGRIARSIATDALHNLRILIDSSAVEVFADDGRIAMATRWFPTADALSLTLEGSFGSARAWSMADGMADTY